MTDGIGKVYSSSNFGVGGFVPQRKEAQKEEEQQPMVQPETSSVNPDEVFAYMKNVNEVLVTPNSVTPAKLPDDVAARAAEATENFVKMYQMTKDEVGSESAALLVLDMMSKKGLPQ